MIPRPHIARWRDQAPWHSTDQIEQDLVISRILVTLFSDEFIRENLAFRGGTALHKLYLHPAPRYSEDIDLVQINSGPIRPILQRLNELIDFFEKDRQTDIRDHSTRVLYRFVSEYEEIPLRIKLEINTREHFSIMDWESYSFQVNNEWFSGEARITTYNLHELLGTKLRALYQRKKGRDLFDLYYADQNAELDYDQLVNCYNEYIRFSVDRPPTRRQYLQNLNAKQTDPIFTGDMEGLLRPGIEYDQTAAFDWVRQEIIERL